MNGRSLVAIDGVGVNGWGDSVPGLVCRKVNGGRVDGGIVRD